MELAEQQEIAGQLTPSSGEALVADLPQERHCVLDASVTNTRFDSWTHQSGEIPDTVTALYHRTAVRDERRWATRHLGWFSSKPLSGAADWRGSRDAWAGTGDPQSIRGINIRKDAQRARRGGRATEVLAAFQVQLLDASIGNSKATTESLQGLVAEATMGRSDHPLPEQGFDSPLGELFFLTPIGRKLSDRHLGNN